MQIQKISLDLLKEAPYNPRKSLKQSDFEYQQIKRGIETYGMIDPIIWNKTTGHIVGGHQRTKVLKDLGYKEIEVSVVEMDIEKEKLLNLALNKTGGDWDYDSLSELLLELKTDGMLDLTGFTEAELMSMLEDEEEDDFEDEDYEDEEEEENEEEETYIAQPGDIWQLGRHRLMCGDSTSHEDVHLLMDGQEADLIVTDPPYNVNYEGGTGLKIKNDHMGDAQFYAFLFDVYTRYNEIMKDGAPIYVFHADSEGYNFRTAMTNAGLHLESNLIWKKEQFVLGRQDYHWKHEPCLYGWKGKKPKFYGKKTTTVWEFDRPKKNPIHPTMKPIDLIKYPIENSTQEGELVVDLFGGSGSTLMAAQETNRTCYTMELDPQYAHAIIHRYEGETNQKARLVRRIGQEEQVAK